MMRKAGIAAGVFGLSLFAVATMTFAQTTTTTPTPTTTTTTTVTPSPTTIPSSTVPSAAPATGRAN